MPPLFDLVGNRGVGPHVERSTTEAIAWARKAGIVKALDNVAALQAAPDDALRIWRHYFQYQGFDNPQGTVDAIIGSLNGYRHPLLIVEVFNEFAGRLSEELAAHVAFLKIVVPMLHTAGVMVGGPCWGTGAYDQGDWDFMRANEWCGLDAVVLHGYWDAHKGPTIWNALRWRQYRNATDPPVIVSECGVDVVRDGDGDTMIGSLGWRLAQPSISAEQCAISYHNYGVSLNQPGEIGATPFTAGPTPDWENYSTDLISQFIPGWEPTGGTMPTLDEQIKQLLAQNAAITEALIALREGRFEGAGSVDGYIAALRGGKLPDGYKPVFPPKA